MDYREYLLPENEQPLDRLTEDGGFAAVFRTIACIGDSMSSGEFESFDENGRDWHDMYEYSWGQYLARMAGCTVYNFSRGGMTAREYLNSFAEERGFWDPALAAQAYIVALGANDLRFVKEGTELLGNAGDAASCRRSSFAGCLGEILCRCREIQPDAKFFLMTIPRDIAQPEDMSALQGEHAELMHRIAEQFGNCYVLDFRKYAPVYDRFAHRNLFLSGHLTPAGYLLTGKMVASYLDYIVRHNLTDFKQIGFMGTSWKNTEDETLGY